MKGPIAKFRIEQNIVFWNLIFFPKLSLWFWGVLEKQTSMAEIHLAKKTQSHIFKLVSYSANVLNLIKGVGTTPPPYVFGKPKNPIVNTYKSWFSSTHASRNRSKFWNQSWVCYPSCHPPCWINISFWSFVNFCCCCGAETCILINIMFWCTGSGITDYCCWMQMNAIL